MRCGGQALNLTAANRVISVDQWWNTAMETQAFGRVHRIGQEKETHFAKIVVKNSIDERLVQMQEEKARVIARALGEDGKEERAVLTVEELGRLFGNDEEEGVGGGEGSGGNAGDGEGEMEVIVVDGDGEGEMEGMTE